MSQTYDPDCFGSGHQAQLDLDKMKNNFAALKSSFSGTASPGNSEAGMLWFHTTNKLLKVRNDANDAWLGVMAADAAHKIFVYRNTAPDGWAIDASVKDCVLALKTDTGTNAYNYEGGNVRGTWTQPDHTLLVSEVPSGLGGPVQSAGGAHAYFYVSPCNVNEATPYSGATGRYMYQPAYLTQFGSSQGLATLGSDWVYFEDAYTAPAGGGGQPHNHGNTYRPYAAVGTLQYMNI